MHLLILVLSLVCTFTSAQLTYSTANLSVARSGVSATSVSGRALFAGGSDVDNQYGIVDIYDFAKDTWTTANLSSTRYGSTATSVERYAFITGGNPITDVVDIYDSYLDTWATATYSSGVARIPFATSVAGFALFAGGTALNFYVDTVDIYDSATDTWSIANLSLARTDFAATSVADVALFAGGLDNADNVVSVVDIWNSTDNTWSVANLLVARSLLAATSLGTKAFFAGGDVGSNYSDVVDIYDSADGSWTAVLLSVARSQLVAVSLGTRVFFAGGFNGTTLSVIDIYDSANDTWTVGDLSSPRYAFAATAVSNLVLFAGGYNPPNYLDSIDIYADAQVTPTPTVIPTPTPTPTPTETDTPTPVETPTPTPAPSSLTSLEIYVALNNITLDNLNTQLSGLNLSLVNNTTPDGTVLSINYEPTDQPPENFTLWARLLVNLLCLDIGVNDCDARLQYVENSPPASASYSVDVNILAVITTPTPDVTPTPTPAPQGACADACVATYDTTAQSFNIANGLKERCVAWSTRTSCITGCNDQTDLDASKTQCEALQYVSDVCDCGSGLPPFNGDKLVQILNENQVANGVIVSNFERILGVVKGTAQWPSSVNGSSFSFTFSWEVTTTNTDGTARTLDQIQSDWASQLATFLNIDATDIQFQQSSKRDQQQVTWSLAFAQTASPSSGVSQLSISFAFVLVTFLLNVLF